MANNGTSQLNKVPNKTKEIKKMKNTKHLTTRQWKVYNFLKENGKSNIRDIASAMPEHFRIATDPRIHNPCVSICTDVDIINESPEIEKIIIHDREYNFWLATCEEEAIEFAERLYKKRALRALKKYYNMHDKAKANGQGKLISCQGNAIDENSKARAFVEAFVDYAKTSD